MGAKRTPFGAFCGKLRDHTSTDLAALAMSAALKNASVDPEHADLVTVGKGTKSARDIIPTYVVGASFRTSYDH